jgi:hypothetical protein
MKQPIWNFEQDPSDEPMDETSVNLRAYFDRMDDEKMKRYRPDWTDEHVIEWDGNFRDDGHLMILCCERDVDVVEYRGVLEQCIDYRNRARPQLFRSPLAPRAHTPLTDGNSRNGGNGVVPSRKSALIAFDSNRRTGNDRDVWIVDPLKPERTRILAEITGTWIVQDWSPDDSEVLVEERASTDERYIWRVDVTGAKTVLTPRGQRPILGVASLCARWPKPTCSATAAACFSGCGAATCRAGRGRPSRARRTRWRIPGQPLAEGPPMPSRRTDGRSRWCSIAAPRARWS